MYDTILHCRNCGMEHRLVAENVVEQRDAARADAEAGWAWAVKLAAALGLFRGEDISGKDLALLYEYERARKERRAHPPPPDPRLEKIRRIS